MDGELKTCTKCKQRQPKSAFNGQADKPDGLRQHCKKCLHAWYVKNKKIIRGKRLMYHFGLTYKQYQEMVIRQQGTCLVCKKPTETLCVDHDHATGRIRGLLCATCNHGLGNFKDNIAFLVNAIKYLQGEF